MSRPKRTHGGRKITGVYKFLYNTFGYTYPWFSRQHWDGIENLPTEGGFVLAPNHMSNFDPVNIGYFMVVNGYETRFLAKDSLFRVPVAGWLFKKWKFVPVLRGSDHAEDALVHARAALDEGDVLGIYVEGTFTRDPAFWPMKAKTGTARLVLDAKVPLIPVVQWGPQDILDRYSKRLCLFRKTDVYVRVLPPIDVSDLGDVDSTDHDAVREVTARLQQAMTQGMEELRGELAPAEPWNMSDLGPTKDSLKNLAKWRRVLAKASRRQDILPADPSVERRAC